MRNNGRIVVMLWAVIAVLVIGFGLGGYFLINHANSLEQTNTQLNGDNDSLRRQLLEAKAAPLPTPAVVATPTSATPTPAPAATTAPRATATPKPTVVPKTQQ